MTALFESDNECPRDITSLYPIFLRGRKVHGKERLKVFLNFLKFALSRGLLLHPRERVKAEAACVVLLFDVVLFVGTQPGQIVEIPFLLVAQSLVGFVDV